MRRFVFAPRWVLGHVVMLVIVLSCVFLGNWQWDVSRVTHSLQNLAYALQWPMFAVFFAVMWLRMLLLESRRLDEEEAAGDPPVEQPDEPARPVAVEPGPAATNRQPDQRPEQEDDPALAAYNRMLAQLAVQDRQD